MRKEGECAQDASLPTLTHNGVVGIGIFMHISEILSQRHSIKYDGQVKGDLVIQVVGRVGAGLRLAALGMEGGQR